MNPVTSLDNYKKHCRERHYSHSCGFCDTMTTSYGRLRKHLLKCHPAAMKKEMRNEGSLKSDEEEKSGLDDCDEPEPLLLSRSCKKQVRRCRKCGFASDDLVSFDFSHNAVCSSNSSSRSLWPTLKSFISIGLSLGVTSGFFDLSSVERLFPIDYEC